MIHNEKSIIFPKKTRFITEHPQIQGLFFLVKEEYTPGMLSQSILNSQKLEKAFSYIESFHNLERELAPSLWRNVKLERVFRIFDLFDNPHQGIHCIHLAGSKGKGSTAAFCASLLSERGLKCGLYTSPHQISYTERISLAGIPFQEEIYLRNIKRIKERIPALEDFSKTPPSVFELLTLLAFLCFKEAGLTWACIETGLGGRLDATNIIDPEAVILTRIEKEHQSILGESLEEIAGEKAGIIKKNKAVFIYPQQKEVRTVFQQKCREMNAPFFFLDDYLIKQKQELFLRLDKNSLLLLGDFLKVDFQKKNAALASLCLKHLFPDIKAAEIRQGLEKTNLSGRLETIKILNKEILMDGAHTPESFSKVVDYFCSQYGNSQQLIFACAHDKNYREMAKIAGPRFSEIIITRPGTFKKAALTETLAAFLKYNPESRLEESPHKALHLALAQKNSPAILVCGSFHLLGALKKEISVLLNS